MPAFLMNWKVLVGLGLAFIIGFLLWQNNNLRDEIADLNQQIGACNARVAVKEAENIALNQTIATQNKAIDGWVARGKELQEKVDYLADFIADRWGDTTDMVDGVDKEPVGPTCEDALLWMLDKAVERRK